MMTQSIHKDTPEALKKTSALPLISVLMAFTIDAIGLCKP